MSFPRCAAGQGSVRHTTFPENLNVEKRSSGLPTGSSPLQPTPVAGGHEELQKRASHGAIPWSSGTCLTFPLNGNHELYGRWKNGSYPDWSLGDPLAQTLGGRLYELPSITKPKGRVGRR